MTTKNLFNREALHDWLISLRTCRFEHPKIRRPLKILRYISMVFCFLVFAIVLAVTLVTHISAVYPLIITTLAFVVAEVIYYAVRAYLLRNLRLQRVKKA